MARRNKQGGAENAVNLIAMLPSWVGLCLAVLTYVVLHHFSVAPKAETLRSGGPGVFFQQTLLAAFAFYGQFVVPAICLIGALVSFLKRKKREGLLNQVTQSPSADALNGMSWSDFELLVGEAFRQQGYQVTEQGGAKADGGVDIELRKGTELFLVQCKQWKALKVGVDVVRELYGVMAARGAAGGFVVTSGNFTSDAKAFAEGRNVMLVEGPRLFGLIQQAKASSATSGRASPAAPARSMPASRATQAAPEANAAAPSCPRCNAPMVRRTAAKGSNAGAQFWGCSTFPACRGTR